MRILLVEDDILLGEAVRDGVRQDGDVVDWVQDGDAARAALATASFDAILLDLGLPRTAGLLVLKGLRARGDHTPVIIITARDQVADRIAGLDEGADDYLVKPFDLDELAARLRAVVRRTAGRAEPRLCVGDVMLDPVRREVTRNGLLVEVTAREFALLQVLMLAPGRVLSRAQLEESLYTWGEEPSSNAVEVHVHHLRRKLGDAFISNLRGQGYRVGGR
jgi:two-component system, OmpR family, response regulator QseB